MNLQTIRVEEFLAHPRENVWRALTERELMSRWLMATDFELKVGARFSFDTGGWGITQCEVLSVVENAELSYSWVNPPLDTVVTWRLSSRDGGTMVAVEHSGFDLDDAQQRFAFEGMGKGWKGEIFARLSECLEAMAASAA